MQTEVVTATAEASTITAAKAVCDRPITSIPISD